VTACRVWAVERKEGDEWVVASTWGSASDAEYVKDLAGSVVRVTEYVAVPVETYKAFEDAWVLQQIRAGNVTEKT